MIHVMPCRNACRVYIHLAFTNSVGPSSVVRSELGPALPFPPMRVLEVCYHGLSVSFVKWPLGMKILNIRDMEPQNRPCSGKVQVAMARDRWSASLLQRARKDEFDDRVLFDVM